MSTAPTLPVRQALQTDALFELVLGSVLLGNPLFGPDFGIPSGVVVLIGFALLLAAVFLGAAALGKGPLAGHVRAVAAGNAGTALVIAVTALAADRFDGTARAFLAVVAVALVGLAALQIRAHRRPNATVTGPTSRRRATPAELRAALEGRRRDDTP